MKVIKAIIIIKLMSTRQERLICTQIVEAPRTPAVCTQIVEAPRTPADGPGSGTIRIVLLCLPESWRSRAKELREDHVGPTDAEGQTVELDQSIFRYRDITTKIGHYRVVPGHRNHINDPASEFLSTH